jgi:hypothetical protein
VKADFRTQTLRGDVTGLATVELLQQSLFTFEKEAGVYKLQLTTSLSNPASDRCIIAIIRGPSASYGDPTLLNDVLLHQTSRFGGVTNVNSTLQVLSYQAMQFVAGSSIGVYCLAGSATPRFSYALNIHYYYL